MKANRLTRPDGLVPVRHADARSCSIAGQVFVADAEGLFRVPAEAVAALKGHGFVPVEEVVE